METRVTHRGTEEISHWVRGEDGEPMRVTRHLRGEPCRDCAAWEAKLIEAGVQLVDLG